MKERTIMTPEAAWAEAMKFENRPNPYPFFDELRKTPVVHVGKGLYVVTGYRELLTLTQDPRVSSAPNPLAARPPAKAGSDPTEPYGDAKSFIRSDPPGHDRMRRQAMRQFGPPHSPDLIPSMEPECKRIVNALLDKARGKTRIDVVDEYAYPLPLTVICKIMGVPLEDEPSYHPWIADGLAGIDFGPEAATEEGKLRGEKSRAGMAAFKRYMAELVERFVK